MAFTEYANDIENYEGTIDELNITIFSGTEATSQMFMSHINVHIKEAIAVYKKMMVLCLNFLNSQNITYLITVSSPTALNIVFSLLFKLQSAIAYLFAWHYSTSDFNENMAYYGYCGLFDLVLYIDFLCNQSDNIALRQSYARFVEMYFDRILWTGMYFKRNYPEMYPNIDILLNRSIYQVLKLNLSIDVPDVPSSSEKAVSETQKLSKYLPWEDTEEQEEIDEQLSTYDLVKMVENPHPHDPDPFEYSMIIELLSQHEVYKGYLFKSREAVKKASKRCIQLKVFWENVGKFCKMVKCKLDDHYFDVELHLDIKGFIKACVKKGFIETACFYQKSPLDNIRYCYCTTPGDFSTCWENDFHIVATTTFFMYQNMKHFMSFKTYPYLTSQSDLENVKGEGLNEKEIANRKDLLEFDMCFNPTSHESFMLYGYLNAYTFSKSSELTYLKGQKTTSVHKEISDFDTMLNCMSMAMYIVTSKLAYKYKIRADIIKTKFGVEILKKEWVVRGDLLNRWPDSTLQKDLCDIFIVLFRNIHMNCITCFKNKDDMQLNIAHSKLRILSVITSFCLLITQTLLGTSAESEDTAYKLIKVVSFYMKALHADTWVKFDMFSEPKDKDVEMKDQQSELNPISIEDKQSNTIIDELFALYEDVNKKAQDKYINGLSPIVLLVLVRNLRNLVETKTKYKEQTHALAKAAMNIFQIISVPYKQNMERYATHILTEIYESTLEKVISQLKSLSSTEKFICQPELFDENTGNGSLCNALIPVIELEESKTCPQKSIYLKELANQIDLIECMTKKNNIPAKNYVLGKLYQFICKIALDTNIEAYLEFCRDKILPVYAKIVLTLEPLKGAFENDPLYEATYGSIVWSVLERNNITGTYLKICERMGEFNQLKKVSQKFKARIKPDTKETPAEGDKRSRSTSANQAKQNTPNKALERKIYKKICTSMLRALLACVNIQYKSFITPDDGEDEAPRSMNPTLTISNKDDLPMLLRETFEIFNKFIKKELKKTTTQIEKDILYECVFKTRCIFDGMENHRAYRFLDLSDNNAKAQAADECNEWYKQLKSEHEGTKKAQILKDMKNK